MPCARHVAPLDSSFLIIKTNGLGYASVLQACPGELGNSPGKKFSGQKGLRNPVNSKPLLEDSQSSWMC